MLKIVIVKRLKTQSSDNAKEKNVENYNKNEKTHFGITFEIANSHFFLFWLITINRL